MPRIAVAQTPGTRLDQWRETLELLAELVRRAAAQGAALLVLPECVWPAYYIGSKQAYSAARAAGLPGHGEFLDKLSAWARANKLAICAGYIAEDDDRLSNAACVVSPDGRVLGVHRKCFLWDFDHDWFEPGQTIEPLDSDIGRIGIMICADARLPEIPATLVRRGAGLIMHPTAWVNVGGPDALWNPQPDFMVPARAREFGVPVASASKWGVEGDTTFVGSSLICDAEGHVLAQCGPRETTVITAEVRLTRPRVPRVRATDRAVLLAPYAPTLRVVIHPPPTSERAPAPSSSVAGQHPLPTLVVQPGPVAARRASASPRAGATTATLVGPRRGAFFLQGVCIAAVGDEDARGFGPIRALALRGAHVVAVFGDQRDPLILRARAAENRVFIVAAGSTGAVVYDPGGRTVASCSWDLTTDNNRPNAPLTATLDTAQATDKLVAPRTDTLAARDTFQYAF
jgi:predicted amidohydrolase